ncbi:MAG: aspartate aminotransferase family protein [Verrucomicrobiota bacterium]
MLPELRTSIPGPESLRLSERLRRVESRNVTFLSSDFPIFWERAEGVNVWDVDGNRFLDWSSAFAVAGLGHRNEAIGQALSGQAERLLHGMGDVHPPALKVELLERLSQMTYERWGLGPAKSVLSSSGFEAVETALKTAVLATGKPGVVTFEGGYHGLGYGTLGAGSFPKFARPFAKQLGSWGQRVPFPCCPDELTAVRAELTLALQSGEVGAILVEPIQGRGGVRIPPAGFLGMLREVADAFGAVLIYDEIFVGFHRTGRLFACEWEAPAYPDLLCVGKALTGGFPLSACIGRSEIMDAWPESDGEALHTSTFLGHPLGCAMALAALSQHADGSVRSLVGERGRKLEASLRAADLPVKEIRGRGLLWGIECQQALGPIASGALARGLIALGGGETGRVLELVPPFAIGDEEIDYSIAQLKELLLQASDEG